MAWGFLLRVVMFKGASQYSGTRLFIDHAAAAFRRRGARVEILDLMDLSQVEITRVILESANRGPADLLFSINIAGEARYEGRTLKQLYGGPHVVWHVDHVLSQQSRIEATPPDACLLVVDPTQVDMLRSFYGPGRFASVGFMPHAAVGEASPADPDPEAFAAGRPIPLLWCGGIQKPGALPWADAPAPTRAVFDDALDLALSVEWMPSHVAFDTALAVRGLDLEDPENLNVRYAAIQIETVVRTRRRFEFIKALARTGLPVHICGVNWEAHLYRFKRATYHGAVDMDRAAAMMREARITLNTNGNFGGGSHERPFSALLAGAAAFSDYSRYYGEVFEDGRDIALYRWKDLQAGMDRLQDLVERPEAAWEIARNGRAKVLAGHTWDSRIDTILTAAGVGSEARVSV